jgi:tagatose 1,6-diphosphate aldolase
VYYDPFETNEINMIKRDFIRSVGEECAREAMPFFLEIVSYSDTIGDEKNAAFAREKPRLVKAYMQEFSQPEYKVDVLKVEMPFNIKYMEGYAAGEVVYTRNEVIAYIRDAASVCTIPFIYLSAGVTIDTFIDSLAMVRESGVKYSGVLCGRATWQDGVRAYGHGGESELRAWLLDNGVKNITRVNQELAQGAVALI